MDAATGKTLWKAFAIDRPPAPAIKNGAGTQMYGPAGAAVWSAPTVDARRDRLYFATGNSYTDVKEGGSDAVVAVDLASGRTVWRRFRMARMSLWPDRSLVLSSVSIQAPVAYCGALKSGLEAF